MKKLTKKEIALRNKEFEVVEEALLHYGAERILDYGVPWFKSFLVKTRCGDLRVHLDCSEDEVRAAGHTIFCRFDEPQRACEVLGLKPTFKGEDGRQMYDGSNSRLNQYSGKWNFHGSDVSDLVSQFFLEFGKVEIKEIQAEAKHQ